MNNRKRISASLVSLIVGVLTTMAGATTLSPVADTYVDAWGNANHGAGDNMIVSYSDVPGRIGYLKFDLNEFSLPAGQRVSSAVLHVMPIYIPFGSADLSVNSVANDSWSESMLLADRPAYGSIMATEAPAGYQYTNFDVTSAFITSYTPGDMTLSLALTSFDNIIYIATRENANPGTRPTLEITTEPVPEPATMGILALGLLLGFRKSRS